jgi:predicted CXXCH cytochrome family protein
LIKVPKKASKKVRMCDNCHDTPADPKYTNSEAALEMSMKYLCTECGIQTEQEMAEEAEKRRYEKYEESKYLDSLDEEE